MQNEIIIQLLIHPMSGQLHALTDKGRILYWSVTNAKEVDNHKNDEDIRKWGWVVVPNSKELPL